ncbi:MAG TPA: LytTR family DNA-binding domain-containing protein [Prolixibacteraceae bacterium]|jgi:DNA-binding LytR/AlgR family response regulator|nr:LytTR family DNA-binding domain-containing protein [Prolixibacteraceae bacterium]HOY50375.1 LytTR family DNA-binding domain-containing protein [Prolixibacteraceae bacterium]HPJ79905.1 LytTR family DNA-binding domain-containing protein [Prolixibacteraceae bacterium]HRV89277.1 LytTR family DNA-binding domain-containing protein [Prolixibacteraceae bacterium]
MNLRTVAVDDEPLALKLITDYIGKTPFLELAGAFGNPLEAAAFLEEEMVDLLFLDIQMPNLMGTEFARLVDENTRVIFTTAYSQYALQGYKLNVVDYLLKPFSYEEFLEAALKARKRITEARAARQIPAEPAPARENRLEASDHYLFLKSEYRIRRINFEDILYIEGLKDYIKVYLRSDEKPLLSLSSMKAITEKLPEEQFMRVHRSFIVNLRQVHTVERSRIVFGKTYIPVSDQYKEKFQEFLDRNFL